ncbi:BA71V-I73R (k10R) [African swine fever virus]|nr:BA71V-I73R (k10R) [African swine fever virus]
METQKLVSMVKEALDKYSYPLTAKAVIQKEYKIVLPTGSINSILYSNTELFEKVDKTNTIYPPLWMRKTN